MSVRIQPARRGGFAKSSPDRGGLSDSPVTLPRVVVHLNEDDTATIAGEGIDKQVTKRNSLGAALSAVAEEAECPIRVELYEPDGSRYIDIISPPGPPTERDPEPQGRRSQHAGSSTIEIARDGFLAGETVLIAPAIELATANHSGRIAISIDRRTTRRAAGGVLVFGTVSGTLLLVES
ncbi:hypothetical protein [Jiangella muralis]|uniref:hypothetical protein n=1 Tax=Jiangella muralis TaxID=702383 RepID=UPI00069D5572|nr:hypothetical protein [Jiangella muralis]